MKISETSGNKVYFQLTDSNQNQFEIDQTKIDIFLMHYEAGWVEGTTSSAATREALPTRITRKEVHKCTIEDFTQPGDTEFHENIWKTFLVQGFDDVYCYDLDLEM